MIDTIDITPSRCQFNAGQFDSDFRYLRKVAAGQDTTMLSGPSMSVNLNATYWKFSWRYRCGPFAADGSSYSTGTTLVPLPAVPVNTPHPISFGGQLPAGSEASFDANAGRIIVANAEGRKALDTDEPLLHGIGAQKSGTINIPQFLLTDGQTRNDTTTWNLGACHPACNVVIGAVYLTGSAAGAVGFDRWTSYMGGDLVWILAAGPKLANGQWGQNPSDLLTYRFYCADGQVWMAQRRIVLGGPNTNFAGYRAHTIRYRLKTAVFT